MLTIRSSKHSLKFANKGKLESLERAYNCFKELVILYQKEILEGRMPLKKLMSSRDLPVLNETIKSHWRSLAYKTASEVIRSNIQKIKDITFKRYKKLYRKANDRGKYKYFTDKKYNELGINILKRVKIDIKNVSINLYCNMYNIREGGLFDNFIKLELPFLKTGYLGRYESINLPFKNHKQSNKYKDWNLKNTVTISKDSKNRLILILVYDKNIEKKNTGNCIGFDCGYKKLLSDSVGNHYGVELFNMYAKISKKLRGSKNYKQLVIHKNNEINRIINNIPLRDIKNVIIEDLLNVKHKSKLSTKTLNKLQYWSYRSVSDKLERKSQEEGFSLIRINPAYTSQTCSSCGVCDKSHRRGEIYHCMSCNMEKDADYNAAINILQRGVYSPSMKEIVKDDYKNMRT